MDGKFESPAVRSRIADRIKLSAEKISRADIMEWIRPKKLKRLDD